MHAIGGLSENDFILRPRSTCAGRTEKPDPRTTEGAMAQERTVAVGNYVCGAAGR